MKKTKKRMKKATSVSYSNSSEITNRYIYIYIYKIRHEWYIENASEWDNTRGPTKSNQYIEWNLWTKKVTSKWSKDTPFFPL